MVDIFVSIVGESRTYPNYPNFNSLSPALKVYENSSLVYSKSSLIPAHSCRGHAYRRCRRNRFRRGIPDPPNTRLTNDDPALSGYTSDYTLVTGIPYTDPVLTACSVSRGRQNEPAVAVDPRDTRVIVGSSNDYCGVFQADGTFLGLGDVWLGYYRSEDGGANFNSSLVPGYQGDQSAYAARSHVRTADSGDPVLTWDNGGRLFAGSESSSDPEGTAKTFGDVWVATYENPNGTSGATTDDG